MSNAMRFGKRSLAGVAAGALALGMLTIASAPAASAAPSIKPKAAVTATVSPVRATYTGAASLANLDKVAFAQLTWASSTTLANGDTIAVTLAVAPSNAEIAVATSGNANSGTVAIDGNTTDGFVNELSVIGASPTPTTNINPAFAAPTGGTLDTGIIGIAANEPGVYAGTIAVYDVSAAGALIDTVSFSFQTTGKPTSMTFTPASQTTPIAPAATTNTDATITLKDATGATTQPVVADWVTAVVSPTTNATIAPAAPGVINGSALSTGTYDVEFGATVAGGYILTASPFGTLPGTGVTAQTASVSVAGSISTSAITAATVTVPALSYVDPAGGTGIFSAGGSQLRVPSGTTSVTVRVTASGATAGDVIRLSAASSAGSPTSADPEIVNVTLNSSKQGTATFTLGGSAVAPNAILTITQVNSANTTTGNTVRVVQTSSSVVSDSVVPTPSGNVVAKVGSATPISVAVLSNFQAPQSGWTVSSYRTSVAPANLISSAVTGANGVAAVEVKPLATTAAGQSESYVFQAVSGTGQIVTATLGVTVLYTTDGTVTSLNVAVAATGASSPVGNTTTSVPVLAQGSVPTSGVASGTTDQTFTVATSTSSGGVIGNLITLTPTSTPANVITVTTPEGVFVSTTTTAKAWNAGVSTATVSSNAPVYVWATKTGIAEVTFSSGGLTTKVPVRFVNAPTDAYNISVTPTTRTIEAGAFSTVELKVTDVFGNPVPGITAGSGFAAGTGGSVAGSASGEVLLSGLSSSANFGTGAAGTATITLIAGKAGTGKVTFTPSGGTANLATAWGPTYTPPTGAPAPVKSADVTVTVTQDVNRSIVITGERATVSGKPGIRVDGIADGFEDQAKVKPWIRFPGETEYAAGSARPVVTDEEFTWQRKTGKKIYVYFTSEDDSIRSNRIIIAAN